MVFDLSFFVAFCTGNLTTATALGTTTGAGVATGTGTTATVTTGGVVTGGPIDTGTTTEVVDGATGTTKLIVGVVSATGTAGSELFAEPVPDCQPIAATMLSKAVAEAPAVKIFEVRAGAARLRR